jgi:hypothetical protein
VRVIATDLLIVARRIGAKKRRAIKAPGLVRVLNEVDDAEKSKEAGTERVELGSIIRLEPVSATN